MRPTRPVTARGGQRCARRQSLPLHRLPADRRCRARGLRRAGRTTRSRRNARRRPRQRSPRWTTARMSSSATSDALLRRAGERRRARRALRRASRRDARRRLRPTSGCGSPRQLRRLDKVIWLGRVAGLDEHRRDGRTRCRIGATVSHLPTPCRALAAHRSRSRRADAALRLACRSATPARSAATSPTARRSATSPPALIALGATLELRKGERVAHAAARGLLHRLRQAGPRSPASSSRRSSCRSSTPDDAFPLLQGLQALRRGHLGRAWAPSRCALDGRRIAAARIAFGGMAATPKRARAAEAALARPAAGRGRRRQAALAALGRGFHAARPTMRASRRLPRDGRAQPAAARR